ncbi:winged helix-turn-helix transcriptional regulator [Herbaspirillum sp. alder98]|uniref:winged helix-turn-helix transcriptional regulator n=1 Tax=Herbaspirillum sp. alder98 TaxID=2913096 RepID=UPI001CD8F2B0|nr:helix-turn-helix domain-containing protein [Herbaspirillum sp. alder98]MCA1323743.1 helix-turn-helix transcriptional regulator [Herbaspirillum sp. alder98]
MNTPLFAYNIYDSRCPTRDLLARLADKWVLLVMDKLENGPMRFNTLRREIMGITQKMLTQTLRKLERDGLIERTVFQTMPVTVEYRLTALATTLIETVTVLAHWAESNMDAVAAAQTAYDSANPSLNLQSLP